MGTVSLNFLEMPTVLCRLLVLEKLLFFFTFENDDLCSALI